VPFAAVAAAVATLLVNDPVKVLLFRGARPRLVQRAGAA